MGPWGGGAGGIVEEKAFHEVMARLKKDSTLLPPPSPLGGGLSFLIYKNGEEK